MAWDLAIGAGIILLDAAYHRWIKHDSTPKPKPEREISLPRTDDGAVVPLVWGRDRVRAPVLAWTGDPAAVSNPPIDASDPPPGFLYTLDMFFAVAIGFEDGDNRLHRMWTGEFELAPYAPGSGLGISNFQVASLSELTGEGNFESTSRVAWVGTSQFVSPGSTARVDDTHQWVDGQIEFLNGSAIQTLTDPPPPHAARCKATEAMISAGVDPALIPSYRNYMCVYLYRPSLGGDGTTRWHIGFAPTVQAYSFEVSSYPTLQLHASYPLSDAIVGLEANPAYVLADLLRARFAKLGLQSWQINALSFAQAAATLKTEGHGYSRVVDGQLDAEELISDIARQIDCAFYEDPFTSTISINLVRQNYDPATIKLITTSNCDDITNLTSTGRDSALPNKVRVVYSSRQKRYEDDSESAHNLASASGQSGVAQELVLRFPGIKTAVLAAAVASRELSARSRPLAKCRAICDRRLIRLIPGEPVAVTWPKLTWDGVIFRVAQVSPMSGLESNHVAVDLIQEFSYVHRGAVVGQGGTVGSFPTTAEP